MRAVACDLPTNLPSHPTNTPGLNVLTSNLLTSTLSVAQAGTTPIHLMQRSTLSTHTYHRYRPSHTPNHYGVATTEEVLGRLFVRCPAARSDRITKKAAKTREVWTSCKEPIRSRL